MTCTLPEPDESGERCVHCGREIGDWGDNGSWVHLDVEYMSVGQITKIEEGL